MKVAILSLAILAFLSADDKTRVESIVQDISTLRANYEQCQQALDAKNIDAMVPKIDIKKEKVSQCQKTEQELKEYKELLKKEQEKSRVLAQKIDYYSNEKPKTTQVKQKILELEKELKEKNKLLKSKESELISLKKDLNKYLAEIEKIKEKKSNSLENKKTIVTSTKTPATQVCEDKNKFPKLVMKSKKPLKNENIQSMKASTFRLNETASIYDEVGGKKVLEWEKNRSFTSNQRTQNWIKITGYFVNRKWQKAEESLWIEESKVTEK